MINESDIINTASKLKKGEATYLGWQRGLKAQHIADLLRENLPGVTFVVHETINGYTINSI